MPDPTIAKAHAPESQSASSASASGAAGVDGRTVFDKVASEPVQIPEEAIDRAVEILRSGRLFRYGEDTGEQSEVSRLEVDFARYFGTRYALAVNSCGCSLFLALKALGVQPGDEVLCNGFTLAPVPSAVLHAGGRLRLVEVTDDLAVDLDDLERQIIDGSANVFLLSHMRGHFGDVAAVADLCRRHGVRLVEDCAHTLGAEWNGQQVGTFGDVACFSSQTFKHLNSGEGGVLITNDADVAAKAILMSGSYMLYGQNGARPDLKVFDSIREEMPNFSMRMSNLVAALLRPQLGMLEQWRATWNERYRWIEEGLRDIDGIATIQRHPFEQFVGSSIQFRVTGLSHAQTGRFVESARQHGVFLKWFGADRAAGFTSRYDQWGFGDKTGRLPATDRLLASLMDMRIPLTLSAKDCRVITTVIGEAMADGVPARGQEECRGQTSAAPPA